MPSPQELMQLGQTLADYCRAQNEREFQDQYYTVEAVSVEAVPMPTGSAEADGLDAIRAKGDWWYGAHEVHKMDVEGPFVHGDTQFSLIFNIDVTTKETGERTQMREIGTYHVNQAGQITREEFSYPVG